MQIRSLEDMTKDELLDVIALRGAAITLLERDLHEMTAKYEAVGAGGVSLMGDAAKDAEIERLRALIHKVRTWDIDRAVGSGLVSLAIPLEIRKEMQTALTQQEP